MENRIPASCISVPVPTELYASVLDQLRGAAGDCAEPASVVTAILQKYLDDARRSRPRPSAVNAQGSAQTSDQARNNDWCIGCGCPSEELLSA